MRAVGGGLTCLPKLRCRCLLLRLCVGGRRGRRDATSHDVVGVEVADAQPAHCRPARRAVRRAWRDGFGLLIVLCESAEGVVWGGVFSWKAFL